MANKTITLDNLAQYTTNMFAHIDTATTIVASKCTFQTEAPTEAITDGGVHIVYLASEPETKYEGYIYFIQE